MFVVRAAPAVVWAVLIFWSSSLPQLPREPFFFAGADKLFHAAAYGVLALLVLRALPGPRTRGALVAAVVAAAYGVTDEIHQRFVPGRSSDLFDWVADAAGAALCCGVTAAWHRARAPAARGGEETGR